MIDIHTHILPGIDDGARNEEQVLALARAAQLEGITDIVATPHHANGAYWNIAADVRELTRRTGELLQQHGIPIALHPGQEIRVHAELLDNWEKRELLTLADTPYMLLEMPTAEIPSGMAELVYELTLQGVRPVIAHPERNEQAMREPVLLEELISLGAWGQVTTHSLLGLYGRSIEKASWSMMRSGLVHLVSSDAHHAERRGFRLAAAYAAIAERLGEEWKAYFMQNAACLLAGDDLLGAERLQAAEASAGRPQGLLRSLFGRRGR